MNPLYEIFNQQYIQQQAQQQHHFQQVKQVQDTAKALKDYLEPVFTTSNTVWTGLFPPYCVAFSCNTQSIPAKTRLVWRENPSSTRHPRL